MKKYTKRPKDYFTPFVLVFFIAAMLKVVHCLIIMAKNGAFDNLF
ncbi:hypothetical protein [Runella sp.]